MSATGNKSAGTHNLRGKGERESKWDASLGVGGAAELSCNGRVRSPVTQPLSSRETDIFSSLRMHLGARVHCGRGK